MGALLTALALTRVHGLLVRRALGYLGLEMACYLSFEGVFDDLSKGRDSLILRLLDGAGTL